MEKYVFYQTNKSCWIVDRYQRERYKYEKEINPIRMALVEVTEQWIQALMELFQENQQEFIDEIKYTLDQEPFIIYSN